MLQENGPVKDYLLTFDVLHLPEFIGGFLGDIISESDFQELPVCFQGTEMMRDEIVIGFNDFARGGIDNDLQAILNFALIILQLPASLDLCESMTEDITALKQWASIFKTPAAIKKKITHHPLAAAQASAKVLAAKKAIGNDQWWIAGQYLGQACVLILGEVEPVYPTFGFNIESAYFEEPALVDDSLFTEGPEFVAGLIYGFTGDNQLEEIQQCFQSGNDIEADARKLVQDLVAHSTFHALRDGKKLKKDLNDALATCQGIDEDLARIDAWAEIFTSPVHLTETISKNWLIHSFGIGRHVQGELDNWDDGYYFQAGEDTADALVLLLGPVQ